MAAGCQHHASSMSSPTFLLASLKNLRDLTTTIRTPEAFQRHFQYQILLTGNAMGKLTYTTCHGSTPLPDTRKHATSPALLHLDAPVLLWGCETSVWYLENTRALCNSGYRRQKLVDPFVQYDGHLQARVVGVDLIPVRPVASPQFSPSTSTTYSS
ncbi:uncharacterized protein BDR25DRAFT_23935 [Lindgomyces ingoldianus]|uniref:Uncharacterized protein n=1 Tax=Lindgomyces ingoldianus TaxID=673940 RepID=A0ACB6QYA1_9PLEO|nr:uncharacterized protein BDR25DRAFT_23935 [Lindgomyces ingoldianus]KAF2471866.1 hypothetical protein BDR25DRAFT_23935 [Lindgomyces ingoldianus]